jgi:hypothetical protein
MKSSVARNRLAIALMVVVAFAFGSYAVAQEQPDTAAESATAAAEDTGGAAPQQAEAQRIFRDSWKVVIDGKTEANGVLELTFEPNGSDPKAVRVNVLAKTKDKDICKELANQLAFTVGSDYKVKQNGNKVTVKAKNKKVAPFWLGVGQQALTGVSVKITKG